MQTNQFVLSQTPMETLLFSWETNRHDFLTWVLEVCGVEEKSETFQFLQANIESESDIDRFVEFFNGDLDSIERTTKMYQESLVH